MRVLPHIILPFLHISSFINCKSAFNLDIDFENFETLMHRSKIPQLSEDHARRGFSKNIIL